MKKKYSKIVIGGGISGLSFGYYHRDSLIIADSLEKKNSPFVFIQENKYTKKLIDDLDLDIRVVDVSIIPKLSEQIVCDKIGISIENFGLDRIANIGNGMVLRVYDVRESFLNSNIIDRICEEGRIIEDKVISIGEGFVKTENHGIFECSEIISTIHFDIFSSISNWEKGNIVSKPIYFKSQKSDSIVHNVIDYCSIKNAKLVNNKITGMIGIDYGETETPGCIKIDSARFYGVLNPPPRNVIFSGRFATANPHWRIEDSLFLAQEGYLFSKMMAEQRRFDKAIQMTGKTNPSDRVKNVVLHIHSEANELLEQADVDWKSHLRVKALKKAEGVLEESIDILKLVLAILHFHNYTEREICEMFWRKSERLWNKFLDNFYGGV